MKQGLITSVFILLAISCSKEQPQTDNKGQDIPASEFQALKKEVDDLKAQVELLTSGFFEVDGLRFDKNGTLISVPKLESEIIEESGLLMGDAILLTTTRTCDTEGRVIEIYRNYNTHSEWASIPYYWQRVLYEYNGKTCRTTTQTCQKNMGAGIPYIEEIKETVYW